MISGLEKYKQDLENLIDLGRQLYQSLSKESPENRDVVSSKPKTVSYFQNKYQTWYSESLKVIKQLLPDRESDFVELYKKPKGRKEINNESFRIVDYLTGEETYQPKSLLDNYDNIDFGRTDFLKITAALFHQQLKILESAQQRFESSLFDIKQLLQADLFDSELSSATELNKKGFIRAAGVIAGCVLEGHLLQVCQNHNISIKKKKSAINDLNQILKDKEILDTPDWRKIQRLADLRNLCSHKTEKEPIQEKVNELIEDVNTVIKNLF